MAYNPVFDRDPRGTFNPDYRFISLVQGSAAYRMDDEFNEELWLQIESQRQFVKTISLSGILKGTITDGITGVRFQDCTFCVDGYTYILDPDFIVDYPILPIAGTKNSLCLVEFWFREVKHGDTLYKYGHYGKTTIVNVLSDSRMAAQFGVGTETARRIVMEFRPRIIEGIDFSTYSDGMLDPIVTSQYTNVSPTSVNFTDVSTDTQLYKSVDATYGLLGLIYAIPITKIEQTTTTTTLTQIVKDTRLADFFNIGSDNTDTQEVTSLVVPVDTRTTTIERTGGQISSLTITDPSDSSVVKTVTVNRVGGQISSIVSVAGGKTVTQTINRVGGIITSITKVVV